MMKQSYMCPYMCAYMCQQAPWTGSLVMKQSAIAAAADDDDGRGDEGYYRMCSLTIECVLLL